jgi:hypothetical protein
MNQKQHDENSLAARSNHCTNQRLLDFKQGLGLPYPFREILLALDLYVRTGELNAPLTHMPQVVYHNEEHKTILVRYLDQGKQKNFFVGPPLTAHQIEAANKQWIDTETTELEGN